MVRPLAETASSDLNEEISSLQLAIVCLEGLFCGPPDDGAIGDSESGTMPGTSKYVARQFSFYQRRSGMSTSCRQAQQSTVKVYDQYLGIADIELPQFSNRDCVTRADFR